MLPNQANSKSANSKPTLKRGGAFLDLNDSSPAKRAKETNSPQKTTTTALPLTRANAAFKVSSKVSNQVDLNELSNQPLVRANANFNAEEFKRKEREAYFRNKEERLEIEIVKLTRKYALNVSDLTGSCYKYQISFNALNKEIVKEDMKEKLLSKLERDISGILRAGNLPMTCARLTTTVNYQFSAEHFASFVNLFNQFCEKNPEMFSENDRLKLWTYALKKSDHYFPKVSNEHLEKFLLSKQNNNQYGFFVNSRSQPNKVALSLFGLQNNQITHLEKRFIDKPKAINLVEFWKFLEADKQMTLLAYSEFLRFTEAAKQNEVVPPKVETTPQFTS